MSQPIGNIGTSPFLPLPAAPGLPGQTGGTEAANFQNLLLGALEQTSALEQSAQTAIGESLAGGDLTQVEVFSAVKKADLALRMMIQIRNKLLDAYTEVQRMQM